MSMPPATVNPAKSMPKNFRIISPPKRNENKITLTAIVIVISSFFLKLEENFFVMSRYIPKSEKGFIKTNIAINI